MFGDISTAIPMISIAIPGVIMYHKQGSRSKRFHLCPEQDIVTVLYGSPVHSGARLRQPSDGSHSIACRTSLSCSTLRVHLCPGAPNLINKAGVPPSFIKQGAFPGKFRRRSSHDPDCASNKIYFRFSGVTRLSPCSGEKKKNRIRGDP
jgi:hypothetical protein